jgi:importin subunit alpha-1
MDCLWGLGNFTNTQQTFALRVLIDMGIVPILLILNTTNNPALIEIPIRIIGNLLTGDDLTIDELISYGVIQFLENNLKSPFAQIRREAAWSLSNIAAGTKNQIHALIQSGVLPKLFELVKDPNTDVVRESIWVCSNCLTGSDWELCVNLVKIGIVDAIIYTIGNHQEPSILAIALEGLKKMFSHGEVVKELTSKDNPFVTMFVNMGGIEYLEKLQSHKSNDVYNITIEILESFFHVTEHNY